MKKILIILCLISVTVCSNLFARELTIYSENFPPYNFKKDKKVIGVSTEIVRQVMAKAGIKYRIQVLPWEQTYKKAQNTKNAFIFSIRRSNAREKLFKWVGILTPATYSALTLKSRSNIQIRNINDMRKYKIGTIEDDIVEQWLLTKGFSIDSFKRTSGTNAMQKCYKNLLNNRIDIWPVSDTGAFHLVRNEGHPSLEALFNKVFLIDELTGSYYLAASLKTSDETISKVKNALKKFKKTDRYYKILAHWGVDAAGLKTEDAIAKLIYTFRNLNRLTNVGYLATDKISAHRTGGMYRKEMREHFIEAYVDTFDEWRDKYVQMQDQADALIIGDISGIKGWNSNQAQDLIQSATKIPTGCLNSAVGDYAVFGFYSNTFIINKKIAKNMKRDIPPSYFKKADRIIE